jgi:hypothetical protein
VHHCLLVHQRPVNQRRYCAWLMMRQQMPNRSHNLPAFASHRLHCWGSIQGTQYANRGRLALGHRPLPSSCSTPECHHLHACSPCRTRALLLRLAQGLPGLQLAPLKRCSLDRWRRAPCSLQALISCCPFLPAPARSKGQVSVLLWFPRNHTGQCERSSLWHLTLKYPGQLQVHQ